MSVYTTTTVRTDFTDTSGAFRLADLPPGTHIVTLRRGAYRVPPGEHAVRVSVLVFRDMRPQMTLKLWGADPPHPSPMSGIQRGREFRKHKVPRAIALLREAIAANSYLQQHLHAQGGFESLWDYSPFQELTRPKG